MLSAALRHLAVIAPGQAQTAVRIFTLTKGSLPMFRNNYRSSLLTGFAIVLLLSCSLFAQSTGPVRPKITGISHVGYFVSDLPGYYVLA